MPDIVKKYAGDGIDKTAIIDVDENMVGLNQFNALSKFVSEEMDNGIKSFTLDFSKLNTVNSSGLGILISCLKKIKDSGGKLNIINANEKILNIFKLTKLNNVFEFGTSS